MYLLKVYCHSIYIYFLYQSVLTGPQKAKLGVCEATTKGLGVDEQLIIN